MCRVVDGKAERVLSDGFSTIVCPFIDIRTEYQANRV